MFAILRATVAVAVLLAAAPATSFATPGHSRIVPAQRPVAGQYIVLLRADAAAAADVETGAGRLAARYNAAVGAVWTHAVRGHLRHRPSRDAELMSQFH